MFQFVYSYQKTSAAAKSAAEKTSTVVAGIGSSAMRKLGDLRYVKAKFQVRILLWNLFSIEID